MCEIIVVPAYTKRRFKQYRASIHSSGLCFAENFEALNLWWVRQKEAGDMWARKIAGDGFNKGGKVVSKIGEVAVRRLRNY